MADARLILGGLIKASSTEADNMLKQTQTCAVKVRQEERGHTRGSPFVWAYLGLINSPPAERLRSGHVKSTKHLDLLDSSGTPSANPNLRRGSILQAGQNVQSRRQESHAGHRVTRETAGRSRSTRSNRGSAQLRTSTTQSHGTRVTDFSGRSLDDVKIMVNSRKEQAARRGTTRCRASPHNVWQSLMRWRTVLADTRIGLSLNGMKVRPRSIIPVFRMQSSVLTVAMPRRETCQKTRELDAQHTSFSLNQRETVAGRLCDAVGGIMAAPRWSHASMLGPRR